MKQKLSPARQMQHPCSNSPMLFEPTSQPERFLRAQPWFLGLDRMARQQVLGTAVLIHAQRRQLVLEDNVPTQGWYAVIDGLVKLSARGPRGRRSDYAGVAAGEWFGEGTVLKHAVRRYQAIALRDTVLLCIPSATFHALAQQDLGFNQFLVERLNLRLAQAMAMVEAGRTRSPDQRVALALSRLFWNRLRQLDLTQDEVASLAGMSRQTANRALCELQERGIISQTFNRIKVLDDEALSRLLSSP